MIVAWIALALIVPWYALAIVVLVRGWPLIKSQRDAMRAVRALRDSREEVK